MALVVGNIDVGAVPQQVVKISNVFVRERHNVRLSSSSYTTAVNCASGVKSATYERLVVVAAVVVIFVYTAVVCFVSFLFTRATLPIRVY